MRAVFASTICGRPSPVRSPRVTWCSVRLLEPTKRCSRSPIRQRSGLSWLVAPNDLPFAKQGQTIRVQSGTRQASGTIIALSPVIDQETRSAKAIAEVDNAAGTWKPGDYVDARLIASEQEVDILVPAGAIQTVKGSKVVFVSESGGFRARPVTTGR